MSDTNGGTLPGLPPSETARLTALVADRGDSVATITDAEGTLLWGSGGGSEHLFGRSPDDYVDHTVWEYLDPDDRPAVERAFETALRGETVKFVYRSTAANGSWVRMRAVSWRAFLSDGEPVIIHLSVPVTPSGAPTLAGDADHLTILPHPVRGPEQRRRGRESAAER